jgi:transcriptional regulator with XRE-family HTH domain
MTRPKKKSARSAGSIDQDIGAAIRSARQTRGVTQQELAARIGVTFQQLQKYESASNRVSAARLVDIAGALDVAITDFLPSIGARSGPNVSAPELAKLIGLYLRLDHADQQRVLDYAARLDGGT